MSKPLEDITGSVIFGAITSATIGTFLFELAGALLLGAMGALGGYIFHKVIKPRVDKILFKFRRKAE